MTSAFAYREGNLYAEDVAIASIVEKIKTPFYLYSTAQLKANYALFASAFGGQKILICYAIKANTNMAVIRTLADCGAGADVTSKGELQRALTAGIAPQKIIYSGVGKRRDEIISALEIGVHQLNVESIPELHWIALVAREHNKVAPIAIRINPDIAARTYKQTSTGELNTKFGIGIKQLDEAMSFIGDNPHLHFRGFQIHIGSHLYDYEPFREAFTKLAGLVKLWRAKAIKVDHLDLGGGVGIPYDGETLPPFSDYATIVKETLGDLECDLSFEPGRRLVGDAGVLISRVIYDKPTPGKRFLILDAGMNDLLRPALYGARHSIIPICEGSELETQEVDVVGPVCETSDCFGENYRLPGVGEGDCVALLQAGAYGSAMASMYNGRTLIPEILVKGSAYAVVRRAIEVEEQISWEPLPPWLGALG